MILLNVADDTDVSVLATLPRLSAVTTGGRFVAKAENPLRRESLDAMPE